MPNSKNNQIFSRNIQMDNSILPNKKRLYVTSKRGNQIFLRITSENNRKEIFDDSLYTLYDYCDYQKKIFIPSGTKIIGNWIFTSFSIQFIMLGFVFRIEQTETGKIIVNNSDDNEIDKQYEKLNKLPGTSLVFNVNNYDIVEINDELLTSAPFFFTDKNNTPSVNRSLCEKDNHKINSFIKQNIEEIPIFINQ